MLMGSLFHVPPHHHPPAHQTTPTERTNECMCWSMDFSRPLQWNGKFLVWNNFCFLGSGREGKFAFDFPRKCCGIPHRSGREFEKPPFLLLMMEKSNLWLWSLVYWSSCVFLFLVELLFLVFSSGKFTTLEWVLFFAVWFWKRVEPSVVRNVQ